MRLGKFILLVNLGTLTACSGVAESVASSDLGLVPDQNDSALAEQDPLLANEPAASEPAARAALQNPLDAAPAAGTDSKKKEPVK